MVVRKPFASELARFVARRGRTIVRPWVGHVEISASWVLQFLGFSALLEVGGSTDTGAAAVRVGRGD